MKAVFSTLRQFAFLSLLLSLLSACVMNRTIGSGVDDWSADTALKMQLLGDRAYNYSDVDITVFEGRLLLTGTMKTEEGRASAAEHANLTRNITAIINEITIAPRTSFAQGTQDNIIDRKLGLLLRADDTVIRNNYQIAVSGGTVYLLGVAQGPKELTRVTDHARTVKGVQSVVSHVLFIRDPRRDSRTNF